MRAIAGQVFSVLKQFGSHWWLRHLAVISIALGGVYLFQESRAEWSEMHRWNRAVGDMSLVLVSMVMVVGPLARLWPRLNFLLPWRRELGIHAIVLAAVHTFIILVGWIEWDFMRLVGFEFLQSAERYVMLQHGFALANIVGIVALLYGTVLAVSSNNRSLKILGGSAWKFVQQGAYVLWVLVLIHTAYFLYLHFLHFHRPVPEPNWGQGPFAILVLVVFLLQAAAFIKTWRGKKERARA